jgi:hypothetical protein
MAIDTRDWYRSWLNKKDGYIEKAAFRISEGERARQKHAAGWRRNFLAAGAAVALVTIAAVAKRASRR